jgi:hypothetical protein
MRRLTAILCVLLLILPVAASAKPKVVIVPWDKLDQMILGERVTIPLPNASIEGMVIAVKADSLAVDVLRSSNPAGQRTGSAELARTSLTTITLHHRRHYIRPLAFVLAIGVAEAINLTVLKNHQSVGTALAVGLGAGFGSQYLARKFSDSVTVIKIQK